MPTLPADRLRRVAADILEAAGFDAIEELTQIETQKFPADAAFWRRRVERSYTQRWDGLDDAGRESLDAAMRDAFEPYLDGDDYHLKRHARVGVGRAPL